MPSPTLNEIFDAYLADRANPHAERPCQNHMALDYHLRASRKLWGPEKIKDFRKESRALVRTACEAWRGAGLAQHTIRKRVSVLKTAFRFAVRTELIRRNAEPIIDLPANGLPRERFVDPDKELASLLKAADEVATPDHIRLLIIGLFLTGVRRGAFLALTWDLVDFEQNVIRFRDTQTPGKRSSNKRRGNKPMEGMLLDEMRHAYLARHEACPFVIQYRGKRVKNPYAALKRVYRRAGLPDLWTHDLRRSSATYVHTETDGDLKAAANHIVDSEATARKHYVQEDPRVHLPAMRAVASVIERARAPEADAA